MSRFGMMPMGQQAMGNQLSEQEMRLLQQRMADYDRQHGNDPSMAHISPEYSQEQNAQIAESYPTDANVMGLEQMRHQFGDQFTQGEAEAYGKKRLKELMFQKNIPIK